MPRAQTIGALLISTVFVLGACVPKTTTPPPETVTATPPPETITITPPAITVTITPPATTVTVTPTPTTAQGASEEVEVLIVGHGFSPQALTVPVGTTVTWVHMDLEDDHTVSSNTALFNADLSFNNTFSYTFTEPGVFKYHCHFHPDMFGRVSVE
jgi:plastocyanin